MQRRNFFKVLGAAAVGAAVPVIPSSVVDPPLRLHRMTTEESAETKAFFGAMFSNPHLIWDMQPEDEAELLSLVGDEGNNAVFERASGEAMSLPHSLLAGTMKAYLDNQFISWDTARKMLEGDA